MNFFLMVTVLMVVHSNWERRSLPELISFAVLLNQLE